MPAGESGKQASVLQLCEQLGAAGTELETARLLTEIEAADPTTDAEWRAVDALFLNKGSRPWQEIMAKRFLAHEPNHLDAQFIILETLSHHGQRGAKYVDRAKEVSDLCWKLARHPDIDAAGLDRLGAIAIAIYNRDDAVELCRAALGRDRTISTSWRNLVAALTGLDDPRGARKALAQMQAYIAPSATNLTMLAEQAVWLKNNDLFRKTAIRVRACDPAPDVMQVARIAHLADQTGQRDIVADALAKVDMSKVTRRWMLDTLLDITRLNGFTDLHRQCEVRSRDWAP